ncbi:MAG: hypothetical protein QOE48_5760 [Mycobacterium sp.]|nr:hypothetical protein [Mycobacterium sp.]MDT5310054.1 hypothetical protein [Mycobacterium sp.]
MLSTRTVARLGILAVGLGIAGAVASATWIAAADSSADWLSSLDTLLSGGAAPAADTTDLAISVDGITILQEGSAHAYSGTNGDFAIADGAGTTATAYGTGDYAYAEGTDPAATAGGTTATSGADGTFDSAFAYGDGSTGFRVVPSPIPAPLIAPSSSATGTRPRRWRYGGCWQLRRLLRRR